MSTLSEHQQAVFLDRYAQKGVDGHPIESTVEEMWTRVAEAIGKDPEQGTLFYEVLKDFKFVPGGRILAGAGIDAEVTYYNCYVIPLETRVRREVRSAMGETREPRENFIEDTGSDSREAIFDTMGLMVDIMSRGGGVGINWSVLRPKGTYLKRVNGTTSGPVSWMDVASRAVGTVEQGGSRRGAAMFMLDDWHPDILEFVEAKKDFTKITNANVSVAVSDSFMEAVREDEYWPLIFPDTAHPQYNTEWDGDIVAWQDKDYPVVEHGIVRAIDLWNALVESAWASGEPGLVFLERYNKESTGRSVERIISVNPCGEQGLGPYSVCNLGAMNLDAYVIDGFNGNEFDWESFQRDVFTAVTFLDRVVDLNYYFIPENRDAQMRLRRIGLGVMGLADALIGLGIRYGSPEAVKFTEDVFRAMKLCALVQSAILAKELGPAPAWNVNMIETPYLRGFSPGPLDTSIRLDGLRNIFLLTQAPTGTTSILAGVNSGIEPIFEFKYTRVDRTGTRNVFAPAVDKYGDLGVVPGPEWVTSSDVTVEEHIAMQAAVQRYVDSSVSKTINGPNSHTIEDVDKAYRLAYDSGLKGIAYFRDGSGRQQVLYKEAPEIVQSTVDDIEELLSYAVEFERPVTLTGETMRVDTRAGSAFVTVNRDETGRPVEVFANVGRSGSDLTSMTEALGRLASLALRKGATLGGVANQLEGVGGNGNFNKPVPHAIGQALTVLNRGGSGDGENQATDAESGGLVLDSPNPRSHYPMATSTVDLCPDCHMTSLVNQEGCSKCPLCGYSRC